MMVHTARLWVLKDPEAEPRVLRGHARWVTLAFDAQGRWLATSGREDNTARLWGS
jgi:WD40 repeat protein